MTEARERILGRLRANPVAEHFSAPSKLSKQHWSLEACIQRFITRQQSVQGEVHRLPKGEWLAWLREQLPQRNLHRLLSGSGEIGRQLGEANLPGIQVHTYDRPIEQWKAELFTHIDVAVTSTRCAIADTGSLVLWPDQDEPRLMSLVPPVHVALLQAERMHPTFAQMIETEKWTNGMPTNALLISGPSKTADIEQTLAYGIHGPKQLITLILE